MIKSKSLDKPELMFYVCGIRIHPCEGSAVPGNGMERKFPSHLNFAGKGTFARILWSQHARKVQHLSCLFPIPPHKKTYQPLVVPPSFRGTTIGISNILLIDAPLMGMVSLLMSV
jgi:hypothetical protein